MDHFPDRPAPARSVVERVRDWIDWFGATRLIAAIAAISVIGVGGFWLLRSPPPTTESRLPYAGSASSVAAAVTAVAPNSTVADGIVVHVAGAVVSPGVYGMARGSRVVDAVGAAGGLGLDADADAINLAAPLHDGDRVFVPHVGQAVPAVVGPGSSASGAQVGPVNLNSATADQLDSLPGVGPTTAAAILAHRDQHGPFASVEGLLDVHGIGPSKFEALRDLVTV